MPVGPVYIKLNKHEIMEIGGRTKTQKYTTYYLLPPLP